MNSTDLDINFSGLVEIPLMGPHSGPNDSLHVDQSLTCGICSCTDPPLEVVSGLYYW